MSTVMYIYIYMYIYMHIFENLTKYIKIYSTPLSFSVLCHHFAKKISSKSPDPEKILQSVDIQKKTILPAMTKSLNESFGVFLHSFQRAGSEFKKGARVPSGHGGRDKTSEAEAEAAECSSGIFQLQLFIDLLL